MRKALESKFEKSLNELATDLIFEPLSMHDTKYIWNSNVDESRFAKGYDNQGSSYETIKSKTPNGADDLLTTIEDYGKFLVSVMNGDGVSEKVFTDLPMSTMDIKFMKNCWFTTWE